MIFNSLSSKDGYCSTIAEVSLTRLHNKNMEGGGEKKKKESNPNGHSTFKAPVDKTESYNTLGEQIIGVFFPLCLH